MDQVLIQANPKGFPWKPIKYLHLLQGKDAHPERRVQRIWFRTSCARPHANSPMSALDRSSRFVQGLIQHRQIGCRPIASVLGIMTPILAPFGSSSHANAPESGTNVGWFLRTRLAWGRYQEDMMMSAEGRTRFPNNSIDKIFDPSTKNLADGLSLTLETTA